jgi:NAD(P)-dependent dehydrogenase (short-subunit alcohol dehydrogenase family)
MFLHRMTGKTEEKSGYTGATKTSDFFAPDHQPKIDLTGKYAVVTGGTNGIGKDTAVSLVRGGANVTIVGRNQAKLDRVVSELHATFDQCDDFTGSLDGMCCDLSDLSTVKAFTSAYVAKGHALDILVNNAGIMAVPKREETKDGFESQIGTNHLGHFALTGGLMEAILKSQAPRVVCVSSMAHGYAKGDFLTDPKLESETYGAWPAYGNAKFANALFAQELHERYGARGLQAASLHPGGIHTGLQTHVGWGRRLLFALATPLVFKSIEQGAATSVYLAAVVPSLNGGYYEDCNMSEMSRKVKPFNTKENRAALWATSEKLTGVSFPAVEE